MFDVLKKTNIKTLNICYPNFVEKRSKNSMNIICELSGKIKIDIMDNLKNSPFHMGLKSANPMVVKTSYILMIRWNKSFVLTKLNLLNNFSGYHVAVFVLSPKDRK